MENPERGSTRRTVIAVAVAIVVIGAMYVTGMRMDRRDKPPEASRQERHEEPDKNAGEEAKGPVAYLAEFKEMHAALLRALSEAELPVAKVTDSNPPGKEPRRTYYIQKEGFAEIVGKPLVREVYIAGFLSDKPVENAQMLLMMTAAVKAACTSEGEENFRFSHDLLDFLKSEDSTGHSSTGRCQAEFTRTKDAPMFLVRFGPKP
jgi:hypothetical protein